MVAPPDVWPFLAVVSFAVGAILGLLWGWRCGLRTGRKDRP